MLVCTLLERFQVFYKLIGVLYGRVNFIFMGVVPCPCLDTHCRSMMVSWLQSIFIIKASKQENPFIYAAEGGPAMSGDESELSSLSEVEQSVKGQGRENDQQEEFEDENQGRLT